MAEDLHIPIHKRLWARVSATALAVAGLFTGIFYFSSPKPDGKSYTDRPTDFTGRQPTSQVEPAAIPEQATKPERRSKFSTDLLTAMRKNLPGLSLKIIDNLSMNRLATDDPQFNEKIHYYRVNALSNLLGVNHDENPQSTNEQIAAILEKEGCVVNLADKSVITPPELNGSGFWYELSYNRKTIGGILFQDRSSYAKDGELNINTSLDMEQKLGITGSTNAVQLYMVAINPLDMAYAANFALASRSSYTNFEQVDLKAATILGVNTFIALRAADIVNDLGAAYDEVITVIPTPALANMRRYGMDLTDAQIQTNGRDYYGVTGFVAVHVNEKTLSKIVSESAKVHATLQQMAPAKGAGK